MNQKRLYKYKSVEKLEYLLDIIQNQRLYLSNIVELNDPLEGLLMKSSGWAGCNYYNGTPMLHPQYTEALEKFRILSLSEEKENVVMWAHYSNNFNGVCIEIATDGKLKEAIKVDYSEQVENNFDLELSEAAEKALCKKLNVWAYEKEWRIISPSEEKYLQLEKREIKKVIIGHKVSEIVRNIIVKMCLQNDIEVSIAFIDRSSRVYCECTLDEYKSILEEFM